jgi:Polyketide cyclase / dehydrase and lipid transport
MAADRPLGFRTHPTVLSAAPPEVVYDVIADLRNHLEWSGERAESDGFKMLTLDAPEGAASVGTTFTSTGSAGKTETFNDRSVVTEASRPHRFVIETDARLERKRARLWEAHFSHRYDITPQRRGSRIVYTEAIERVNYVPYRLKPVIRTFFRPLVNSADRKQLRNLARLAEERSTSL